MIVDAIAHIGVCDSEEAGGSGAVGGGVAAGGSAANRGISSTVEVAFEFIGDIGREGITGEGDAGAADIEGAGVAGVLGGGCTFEGGVMRIDVAVGVLVANLGVAIDDELEVLIRCLDEKAVLVSDGRGIGDLAVCFGVCDDAFDDRLNLGRPFGRKPVGVFFLFEFRDSALQCFEFGGGIDGERQAHLRRQMPRNWREEERGKR